MSSTDALMQVVDVVLPPARSPGATPILSVAPARSPAIADVVLSPTRSPGVAVIPPVAPTRSLVAKGGSVGSFVYAKVGGSGGSGSSASDARLSPFVWAIPSLGEGVVFAPLPGGTNAGIKKKFAPVAEPFSVYKSIAISLEEDTEVEIDHVASAFAAHGIICNLGVFGPVSLVFMHGYPSIGAPFCLLQFIFSLWLKGFL